MPLAWLIVSVVVGSELVQAVGARNLVAAEPVRAVALAERDSPYHPVSMPGSAKYYYQSVWGIDHLVVHMAASGTLVRFSYRVTDPVRAAMLGNKRAEPYLIDERSHVVLRIPIMEQVGPLWQTVGLAKGKKYWMTFSNKGNPVRPGHRVNVVIGTFHADGLRVE